MARIHYIAYGSNLHPLRLTARVPSARAIDVLELPRHQLAFHKRSVDGSAKCHVYSDRDEHHSVYGVLYEFEEQHKKQLDAAEGAGYRQTLTTFRSDGGNIRPYTYVARPSYIEPDLLPYHWYKELVLAGARYHGFPEHYISRIQATPSTDDPDESRARKHQELLGQMVDVRDTTRRRG